MMTRRSEKQPGSGNTGVLAQVKAALPIGLKRTLRPAVEVVAPALLNPPRSERRGHKLDLSFCDQPVGNSWTIRDPTTGIEYRIFFLCGCWKSGTHWIQAILNRHPKVQIKGEYHFEQLLTGMDRFTLPAWCVASHAKAKAVAVESFQNLVRRMMYSTTRAAPEATWLGDRTPRMLREVLPGAPMYWLLRDGRDVLVSWAFHWLRVEAPGAPYIRTELERLRPEFRANPDKFRDPNYGLLGNDQWVRRTAREWAEFIRNDFEQYPLLQSRGTPVFKIVYEDLHQRPHDGAAEIYRFLGLDPAEAQPLTHESKTLPGFKSEDLKSATRKGQTGDWQNYFSDRIRRIFKEEAGEALVQAGYERDLNW